MVTAIGNGASCIYTFDDIEKLKTRAKEDNNSICAGERQGIMISGFDLGNSPLEFTENIVKGKSIYMSTSNGTRALENSRKYSDDIYIASFLNLNAVVKLLLSKNKDILFVCSGTNDNFSLDDGLCVGMIIEKMFEKSENIKVDDTGLALRLIASIQGDTIHRKLQNSKHYNILKSLGFVNDLNYCLKLNQYNLVSRYINGRIL